ncbi:C1 family peptidase, partial [Ureaplasma zalophigenitalium]
MKIKIPLFLSILAAPFTISATVINQNENKQSEIELWKLPRYDQRENFILSPVRKQLQDICWAYSIVGVSEANIVKNQLYKIPDTLDLSEKSIAFKTKNRDINSDPLGNSNFDIYQTQFWNTGGFTKDAGYAVMQWNNLINETEDFKGYNFDIPYKAEDFIEIDHKDRSAIKKYIVKNGAVGFGFSAGETATYYNELTSTSQKKYGHAATIIGWDDNISKDLFGNGTKTDGAWIVKNSWGTHLLEKGYMYISYETNISETFTFNYVNKNKYDNNYYYDGFLKDI